MQSLLVVDDDEQTCEAVQRLLGRMGYVVACATNGAEALSLLHDLRFDLVILDWMMPGMDGLEVLRRLRSDPDTRGVRVILYSAADDPDTEREAFKLGASDVVLKSGGFFALYDRIEQVLPAGEGAPPGRRTSQGAAGAAPTGTAKGGFHR